MRTLLVLLMPFLLLGACGGANSAAPTRDPVLIARAEAQAELDALMAEFPEAGDPVPFYSRLAGTDNAWPGFIKAAVSAPNLKQAKWAELLHEVDLRGTEPYDKAEIEIIKTAIPDTDALASEFAAVASAGVLVPIANSKGETDYPAARKAFDCMKWRAVAQAILGEGDAAAKTVEMLHALGSKFYGVDVFDWQAAVAVRRLAVEAALLVCERVPDAPGMLERMASHRALRASPREMWLCDAAEVVAEFAADLKDDAPSLEEAPAGALKFTEIANYFRMFRQSIALIPVDLRDFESPKECKRAIERLNALLDETPGGARDVLGFLLPGLVVSDLDHASNRLALMVKRLELQTDRYEFGEESLAGLRAEFPCLHIRFGNYDMVTEPSQDHPLSMASGAWADAVRSIEIKFARRED